jgi:lipoprotein-anchoring transpeptidase ErfK/SrfK
VGLPSAGFAGDHGQVTILRAAVLLLVTFAATCLFATGVADAAPAPSAKPAAVPCKSTARACVKLSTNQAWLLDGGRVVLGPVRVSHGRVGFRTPPGTFRVSYKDQDHISTVYDQPMPYSVFFNGDIAFHSGSVRVLSHGCVHLPASAARTFFSTLKQGDVVQVVA